ncbi:hypothetical protein CEXT_441201 [Caerostris extrusa]|uniref:Uncharacterized protein n=1 Tax=Caerostris extrusa TaxID=172846 RepID=A0AAV4UBV9_CAEEX|nr:hypothetical protein CEXT_441201 [Caerostris extrusa]
MVLVKNQGCMTSFGISLPPVRTFLKTLGVTNLPKRWRNEPEFNKPNTLACELARSWRVVNDERLKVIDITMMTNERRFA